MEQINTDKDTQTNLIKILGTERHIAMVTHVVACRTQKPMGAQTFGV